MDGWEMPGCGILDWFGKHQNCAEQGAVTWTEGDFPHGWEELSLLSLGISWIWGIPCRICILLCQAELFQLEVFPLLHRFQAGLAGRDFKIHQIHQIPAPPRLLQAPSWDTSMDRAGFLFSWRNPLPVLGWLVKGVKITFRR